MIEVINAPTAELIAEGNFSALVKVYGFTFACSYVAGEFNVRNVSGTRYNNSRANWQISKNAQAVREWLRSEIAALGADFHAAHAVLYELDMAA